MDEGKASDDKEWKNTYFYLYDVPLVWTQFNLDPRNSYGAPSRFTFLLFIYFALLPNFLHISQ